MAAEHDVDKIVRDAFFRKRGSGVLVEVGAARPDYLSISASYRSLGWKIVSIEPNPEFCKLHRERGYEVLEYAAGEVDADDVDFYVVDMKGAKYMGGTVSFESFSSLGLRDDFAAQYDKTDSEMKKIQVKLRKLDTILATHEPDLRSVDILAADVEGWELEVMRGLTEQRYRPSVAILENLFDDPKYIAYMEDRGFIRWRRLAPNDIFVSKDVPLPRGQWIRDAWSTVERLRSARARRSKL